MMRSNLAKEACIVLYLYLFKVGNSTDTVYSKRSHYKKKERKKKKREKEREKEKDKRRRGRYSLQSAVAVVEENVVHVEDKRTHWN